MGVSGPSLLIESTDSMIVWRHETISTRLTSTVFSNFTFNISPNQSFMASSVVTIETFFLLFHLFRLPPNKHQLQPSHGLLHQWTERDTTTSLQPNALQLHRGFPWFCVLLSNAQADLHQWNTVYGRHFSASSD